MIRKSIQIRMHKFAKWQSLYYKQHIHILIHIDIRIHIHKQLRLIIKIPSPIQIKQSIKKDLIKIMMLASKIKAKSILWKYFSNSYAVKNNLLINKLNQYQNFSSFGQIFIAGSLNRFSIYQFCSLNKNKGNEPQTNSRKIKQILASIPVSTDQNSGSNSPTNLLESGLVAHQHFDPQTKKLTIQLNISKDYMKIKNKLKEVLLANGFVNVDISIAPKEPSKNGPKGSVGAGKVRKGNLQHIKKIIAVSSCKGGVGKSTIAINIAANLKNMGFKVGIFDSDIYGPSLPTLINKQNEYLQPSQSDPKQILPKYYQGLTCMSFGFVGKKPATIRGPMVSSIVSQLLLQTQWSQLDYLIVDMPPGTGDIQISLCQQINFDGAVIVTTPQRLAYMDVIKGIQMFQGLKVGILGVVENMAYYECSCGKKDFLFGKGYTKTIMDQFGIKNAFQIPLVGDITKYSDLGTPLAFVLPDQHPIRTVYNKICESVVQTLKVPQIQTQVHFSQQSNKIVIQQAGKKKEISPYQLRLKCRCAGCIDELTGALLIKKDQIKQDVKPLRIQEKGNYAVAVVWSDGHKSSIYPYARMLSDEITGHVHQSSNNVKNGSPN